MSIALDPIDHFDRRFRRQLEGRPGARQACPRSRAIASLVGNWDDRLYAKHLAPLRRARRRTPRRSSRTSGRATARAPASAERTGNGSFTTLLTCERGGDIRLDQARRQERRRDRRVLAEASERAGYVPSSSKPCRGGVRVRDRRRRRAWGRRPRREGRGRGRARGGARSRRRRGRRACRGASKSARRG